MTESQKSERGGAKGEGKSEGRAEGKHEGKAEAKGPASQMLINYVPGEECRVAIVEDGKLEELHVERFSQASHVGSIYVGRVVNVEQAIQAAFVDFGMPENGFLHVTDLHPKYFPGEGDETTERVGFKTPRRERPPIQHALRRGDEVIVQVLKEGVGTKGPTVTSYLSIPGRFLVMMPGMDRVGVSRKVEDEEQRRKMREILDQLDLPEGFGFILRTAGFSRTKAELKRDLAYLMRLWKDMDRRLKTGGKPRLLYSESDLLVRSLRDLLSNEINEVVIDHDAAMRRAARFMKIVAPRTTTKLLHYPGTAPVFHAFGIEKQISLIHAREVPLPSGGRLVIDQTEALVAIDVNSGKSRDSRDSETNAYQTNLEAVDEICRQLRLRDMGGIVVNDLIDMRESRHRKDIENRVRDRLKRDRAKTTIGTISEFGILEMTRQRMRPSHESVHFTDCPMCRGRGMLQKPESVSADALRDLAAILDATRVSKVEMVVAPRVAGELLSNKRAMLGRIERRYGKHVDVRVSETVPADRVSFYAYDAQGADIDVGNLPQPRRPKDLVPWADLEPSAGEGGEGTEWTAADDGAGEPEPEDVVEDLPTHPIEIDDDEEYLGPVGTAPRSAAPVNAGAGSGSGMGQGGGRGGAQVGAQAGSQVGAQGGEGEAGGGGEGGEGGGRRRRRRRRRGRGGQGGAGGEGAAEGATGAAGNGPGRANAGPGADGAARDVSDEGSGGDDGVDGEGAEGSEGPDGGGPRGEMRPPRLGPDGQPLPDGEGGGRRRRRRRRRGRGGQGGQGEQAGQGGQNVQGGQSVQPAQMNQGGHSAQAHQQAPSGGGRSGPRPDDRGRRGAPSDGGRPRLDASPETGGDWGDDGPIRIKPVNGTGTSTGMGAAGAMPGRDADGSATGDDVSGEHADAPVMPVAPLAPMVTDELEAEAMADRAAMARSAPAPAAKPAGRGSAARAEAAARVAAAPDEGADGDADDGGDDGDGSDAGGGGAAGEGGEGGEAGDGTKRRRRRRRRRGRGGAGGAGGAGGEAGGDKPAGDAPSAALTPVQPAAPRAQTPPKAPVERAPRAESPRADGGRGGGGRPAREARPAPAPPAREVKPVAVTPPAAAVPKPRTLYGAVRRKLTPAELNKRPKPE